MADRLPSAPLLVRLLANLLHFRPERGEDDVALIARWLETTEPGRGFVDYLSDEAELLAMAANRLNISGDEALREIARELGKSAERLRTLIGHE